MSTPTDLHPAPAAVLTHPAFDRPAVLNARWPGPKKGTFSLAKARSKIAGERAWNKLAAEQRAAALAAHAAVRRVPVVGTVGDCGTDARSVAGRPAQRIPPLQRDDTTDRDAARRLASPDPWKASANEPPRRPLAPPRAGHEDAVIAAAMSILEDRMRTRGQVMGSPRATADYLMLQLAEVDHEVFGVMFLDTRNSLIAFEILFEGSLTQTSVHPREVVRRALQLNAGAAILAHNHPSGDARPSRADEFLTNALRAALALVDVRVLDHVIVAGNATVSLAELGVL